MAGCVVLAVGLAWAVVWGECVCAPVSEHAHAAGVGGYPVFWVEAGMEGC